jgi:hypothetical protein
VSGVAHSHDVIGDKGEAAYRRGDALEKRRKLMDACAAYCESADTNVCADQTQVAAWQVS